MSTHSQVPTAIKIKQKMVAMLLQKHLAREIQTRVFHVMTQSLHLSAFRDLIPTDMEDNSDDGVECTFCGGLFSQERCSE